jgi:hypothetical protein
MMKPEIGVDKNKIGQFRQPLASQKRMEKKLEENHSLIMAIKKRAKLVLVYYYWLLVEIQQR